MDKITQLELACSLLGSEVTKINSYMWKVEGKYNLNYTPHLDQVKVKGVDKILNTEDPWTVAVWSVELPELPPVRRQKSKTWRTNTRIALNKKQNNKCALCGKPMGEDMTVDHMIPVSKGGSNKRENLQLVHEMCNKEKGSL
jgi:5-methylcytosine-specific restriction endonuclease McrA